MNPVANARMYSVNATTKTAWRQVLAWVLDQAGLPWSVIDHDPPAPMNALWARPDLGLALMCGLPLAQRREQLLLLAAPVPLPPAFGNQARYWSDIVVRGDAPYQRLEDTFGGVVGYTVADSMSGAVALQHHLLPHRLQRGTRLYRAAVGGLLHARGVIQALAERRIDVGPLDAYYHALLRAHEPALTAQVRVIATTEPTPIPALVATAPLAPDAVERLRKALGAVADAPALAAAREQLLLRRFVLPDAQDYAALVAMAASVQASGFALEAL